METSVNVEVLGHLIFYLPVHSRDGAKARAEVPVGTTLERIPDMLGIPPVEIQSFVVNGETISNSSFIVRRGDAVVILPVISGG